MLDYIYQAGWSGLMNSVAAAIVVFGVRAVFVLRKKRVIPYIWGLVFLAALCPVGILKVMDQGYVVEALLGSSVKFYFFLLWEGVAALLILWNFYECRKRRWKSLECEKLDENIFIMKGIKKAKVCGFFRPVIYLPEGLDEQVRKEVLKRKHRLIDSGGQKLTVAASVITFLYWFNPVLWLSLYYMKEDLKRL